MRLNRSQQGLVSIEFAAGAGIFFFMLLLLFELCRLVYSVNLIETGLRESSRAARTKEVSGAIEYKDLLKDYFSAQDSVWGRLIGSNEYSVSVQYFKDFNALVAGTTVADNTSPIAEYSVSYAFSPVVVGKWFPSLTINRSVLAVQEFQGWPNAG